MDYVKRLTQLREDRDIKQRQVAGLLGCRQSAMSKYETRKAPYRVEAVAKLCEFYQISADYVLGLPEKLAYPKRS